MLRSVDNEKYYRTLFSIAATAKITKRLLESLGVEEISVNCRKLQSLLADGVGRKHPTKEQRTAMDDTGLTVVQQGIRVVGVLIIT